MSTAPAIGEIGEIGENGPIEDIWDPLNPHTMYDFSIRARAEQPVFYNLRLGFWVVTRYEDIDEIENLTGGDTVSANGALTLIKPPCPAALEVIIEAGIKVDNSIVDEDPPDHGPKRTDIMSHYIQRMREFEDGRLFNVQDCYNPNVSHRGVEHVLVTWDPAANPVAADRP